MSRLLRAQLLDYCGLVYQKGWVANHDGNLTVRLGAHRILATPTAMSKRDIQDGDLITVDEAGTRLSGKRRPFSELALHNAIYRARPDAGAVIHAHPPYATAMSVAGVGLEQPLLAEAVVSLGARVPLVPFAMPKTPQWVAGVEREILAHDALILQNHGVITCGDTVEQAFLRMELVEHLATVLHHAMAFGGPRPLEAGELGPLLEARTKAGLGPKARGVTVAEHQGAPIPSSPRDRASLGNQELVKIITEEIAKLAGA